jgi:NAD+ kinase
MEKFYIITNSVKDPAMEMAGFVRQYLTKKGKTCIIQEQTPVGNGRHYRYTDAARIPEDVDCVLVVGGDGTLLQACRDLGEKDIPLLGINMGTLGYLAEIDRQNVQPALDRLIRDEYVVERRMMLEGTVRRKAKRLMEDMALNDIVIGRDGKLRIIDFNIYVNGEFLNSYSADGIIVSTPTGSTGYSLSAGGPIVSPEASLILLSPIAPHTLNTRSIILPDDVEITVELKEGHRGAAEGAVATFDGDTCVSLGCGDRVIIRRSGRCARLVKINNISFLEVLRKKMSGQ